jgi:hypothetical protein
MQPDITRIEGGWRFKDGETITDAEAEARIAPPPAHETGWQPIETAPKNGLVMPFLARRVKSEALMVMFGYWSTHQEWWYRRWPQVERIYPTHWMPLPAPPAPREDA